MQKPDVVEDARHGMWRNKKRLRQMRAWGPDVSTSHESTSKRVSAPTRLVKSSRVAHPRQRRARACSLSICLSDWTDLTDLLGP